MADALMSYPLARESEKEKDSSPSFFSLLLVGSHWTFLWKRKIERSAEEEGNTTTSEDRIRWKWQIMRLLLRFMLMRLI